MHVKGTAAYVCKKSIFFFISYDEPHHANDEVCARSAGYTIFYLKLCCQLNRKGEQHSAFPICLLDNRSSIFDSIFLFLNIY